MFPDIVSDFEDASRELTDEIAALQKTVKEQKRIISALRTTVFRLEVQLTKLPDT